MIIVNIFLIRIMGTILTPRKNLGLKKYPAYTWNNFFQKSSRVEVFPRLLHDKCKTRETLHRDIIMVA